MVAASPQAVAPDFAAFAPVQHPHDYGLPSRPVIASKTFASPMSYVGSSRRAIAWAQRVGQTSAAMAGAAWTLAVVFVLLMWLIVLPIWYFFIYILFGIFFIPFRLMRRSQRKQTHVQETQLATMQAMLAQQQASIQRTSAQPVTVVTAPSPAVGPHPNPAAWVPAPPAPPAGLNQTPESVAEVDESHTDPSES